MSVDYSQLSDEELDKLYQEVLSGGSDPATGPSPAVAKVNVPPPEPVDPTMGMSTLELALAGAGGEANELIQGLKEKFELAFAPKGKAGDEVRTRIQNDRAQREKDNALLYSNTPANFGKFGFQALTAMGAPARIPAQMAVAGLMEGAKGGLTKPTGVWDEMVNSTLKGGESAALTGAIALPIKAAGNWIGAATNRFTPAGEKAILLDEAANRVGVKRSIGSLDPSSQMASLESQMPGYSRTVEKQVQALDDAAKEVKTIPSSTGRSTTERELKGEKIRQALVEAGDNLKGVGQSLWNDLDDFIVQNNLPGVRVTQGHQKINQILTDYTPIKKGVAQVEKNPIIQRIELDDPTSAELLKTMALNPKSPPVLGFSEMHQLQASVGRALRNIEKDAKAPNAKLYTRQLSREFKSLYGSLMQDVDSWGVRNPSAQKMFDEARTFWRDMVVPGVINNKPYQKAWKKLKGLFPSGHVHRVENPVLPGTPDVNGCICGVEFWCELKHVHTLPKLPDTPVFRGKLKPEQILWHVLRRKAGGRSYIVGYVEEIDEFFILDNRWAKEFNNLNLQELRDRNLQLEEVWEKS